MTTKKITSAGSVTIPRELRAELGIPNHDKKAYPQLPFLQRYRECKKHYGHGDMQGMC